MPRAACPTLVLALLVAAGSAGCATPFGAAPAMPEPPALLTSLPDSPDVALQDMVIEPSPPSIVPARQPAAARTARSTRPVRATAAKDVQATAGTPAAGGLAAGPSITTYTYSDAPVAVRRSEGPSTARQAVAERPASIPAGFNPYRIAMPAGAYRCELGRSVQVRDVSADMRTTVLRWGTRDYTLQAVQARSGALRYEDASSGLAWIVIPGTSMLLNTQDGQRLANACRA
jgi:hypothetical protein